MARVVLAIILMFVAAQAVRAYDMECCDSHDVTVPKPDGIPCNSADVCGRYHCLGGTCVDSIQYTCKFDSIDRVTVVVVLLVISGSLSTVALALLFRGGELVARHQ